MKTLSQPQRKEYLGARRAAHALRVKVGDADDLKPLFPRNDGVRGALKIAVRGIHSGGTGGRRPSWVCRSLRITHGQFLSEQGLRQIGDVGLVDSASRSLVQ